MPLTFLMTNLPYALACVVLTLAVCLQARPLAARLRLLDHPDGRKKHAHATPLMGGVAILLAFVPCYALHLAISASPAEGLLQASLLISIGFMTLLGILDDRHSLSARTRLAVTFAVFVGLAIINRAYLVRYLVFEYPDFAIGFGAAPVAVLFTSVCCVGLINAVNMADGKNGLVLGLAVIWCTALLTRVPQFLGPPLLILLGMLLILLAFNLKGRLFLGDGGAYGLSTAVGLIAILAYNSPGTHGGRAISAGELAALFAIPVLDSFRLTFVRIRRGQSPMAADRGHLHHILLDRFGWPGGLIIYLALAIAITVLAFSHPA